VLHAKALPGNPYDGHTLRAAIEATQRLTGRQIERAYVDKGYRGHDAPHPRHVFISGQKRGVFGTRADRCERHAPTRTMQVVERYMRMILKDELEEATINRLRLGSQANSINFILSGVRCLRPLSHRRTLDSKGGTQACVATGCAPGSVQLQVLACITLL
jgi:hypothetical protein